MCGRYTLHATSKELADGTACPELADFREERRYNIAPGQWVIVVRPDKGARVPGLAQPVSAMVGNPRNDGPELVRPLTGLVAEEPHD